MPNGKKTFRVGTSIIKGIGMKEVNSQLHNSFAKRISFPGVTLKHLKYYLVPFLIDNPPPPKLFCIFHGGCNDVNNKNSTSEKIANKTRDTVMLCCGYDNDDTFISAII